MILHLEYAVDKNNQDILFFQGLKSSMIIMLANERLSGFEGHAFPGNRKKHDVLTLAF